MGKNVVIQLLFWYNDLVRKTLHRGDFTVEKTLLRLRRMDKTPLILLGMMLVMWTVLHMVTGIKALGSTAYNTYTLQALAWRDGRTWVDNLVYLELAIFEDRFYVSFPPVPSVVLYPLTFIFGADTPDNLLVKLYACAACLMMYFAFRWAAYSKVQSALGAFLLAFASSLLPLTLEGAVWYHAQVLGFFLVTAAICLIAMDKPTPALFLYALAVGCRPFNALYGLPLMLIYISLCLKSGQDLKYCIRRMWKGVVLGLMVAAAYAAYNFVRFGNPLEFGHNYLPEFSFQGGVQFSLGHILNNIKTFWMAMPFDVQGSTFTLRSFGFSMFIACPALTLLVIWFAQDLLKKRMTVEKTLIFVCFAAHMFLLLMHRTFGGFQFGARYCADLVPYAFFYQLMRSEKRSFSKWEWIVLGAVFVFTMYGAMVINL